MASLELSVHGANSQLIAVERTVTNLKRELDESRRDEWSTEAVNSLLDVYEEKWNHRNRGNLKGGDWEDVALRVSARWGGTRTPKTPFQCKNKVASMKQKYRSESLLKGTNGTVSRWPYFARMDIMLRVPTREDDGMIGEGIPGPDCVQAAVTDVRFQEAVPQVESGESEYEVMRRERGLFRGGHVGLVQGKLESRGVGPNRDSNQEDASNTLPQRKRSAAQESDTSTPRSKVAPIPGGSSMPTNKLRKHLSREVAANIRSFAGSILKLEKAKMEMFKDSERLRAELEARRVDMELKRTEIIMNTQLQIAKLLSGNPRKRKGPNAKSTNGGPASSDKVTTELQNYLLSHPTAVMQNTLSTNKSQPMHTISSGNISPTSGLAQPLHSAVQSKQC